MGRGVHVASRTRPPCGTLQYFFSHARNPRTATLPDAQCYCPYTHCAAGVSIVTADGRVSSGGYVESAAYNPGLPPFQAAVVAAIVGGMPSYDQVMDDTVHRDKGP